MDATIAQELSGNLYREEFKYENNCYRQEQRFFENLVESWPNKVIGRPRTTL